MPGRVFLVTGTTTGFGKHLVQEILDKGDIAVATARNPGSLSFSGTSAKNYLAVELDVTRAATIDAAFEAARAAFGRVDVVVNNAGYGVSGPLEEISEAQMRRQFDVNFFGLAEVTRRALAAMRTQSPPGGLIQQVTSIGGQLGVSKFSAYCGTKWAVEGFSDAVQAELKPEWRIKLMCVEPGGFRTDWAGRSMEFPESRLDAYDHIDARGEMSQRHGSQAGDPKKGGQAIYSLACLDDPPARAVIGSDAHKAIQTKIKNYSALYARDDLAKIALSCDVDE